MNNVINILQTLQYNHGYIVVDGIQTHQANSVDITANGVVKISNGSLKGHELIYNEKGFVSLGTIPDSKNDNDALENLYPQKQYHLLNGLLHLKEVGLTLVDWKTLTNLLSK